MGSTYFALYYHIVFGTKRQEPTIDIEWRDRLHAYLGGLVRTIDGVACAVGGVADHVHILASLRPTHQVSKVLWDIKRRSSAWVHDEIGFKPFEWQDGYGAFTVSVSRVGAVKGYIAKQEEHHRKQSFRDEFIEFLRKHRIEFKEEYLL
ncbi:IS200/IS605 family transposase [Candidatus Sumerlaeota bacterium]|nr:IS200/IS605 family transposase [Candidatus Sumerlaeota bacterium]